MQTALAMDIARPDLAKKKKRKNRLLIGASISVLVTLTVIWFNLDFAGNKISRNQIWVSVVKEGDMTRTVEGIGTLVAKDPQWIAARSDGWVQTVHTLPGNWVEVGSAIVTLSNPELEQQQRNAKLELDAAEAELISTRARLLGDLLALKSDLRQLEEAAQMARIDADIAVELHEAGLSSDLERRKALIRTEQLDARLELEKERLSFSEESIEPELAVFKTRVNQAQANHQLLVDQVNGLIVKATSEGVLQKLTLEAGMQVSAGTQIAQVADPTNLKAVIRISETQTRALAPGQIADVNTRTSGRIQGILTRIDPNVETGTVAVDIQFNDPLPDGCRADQTIDGIITIDHLPSVLLVERPPMVIENDQVRIFKLSDDERTAERVLTQFGRASVAEIEIVKGLSVGDKIIISDTSRWDNTETLTLE